MINLSNKPSFFWISFFFRVFLSIILVNIFAGINRCDWVAEGIVDALKKIQIKVPLVIRLAGTNVEKGNKILKESKINYIEANTLEDAANKAVAALNK